MSFQKRALVFIAFLGFLTALGVSNVALRADEDLQDTRLSDPADLSGVVGIESSDPENENLKKEKALRKNPELPFRESSLTSNLTEDTVDRRKLILTTGEDKVVDLKFDGNPDPKGMIVGNPKVVVAQLVKTGEGTRQVNFKPLSPGTTTVTMRDAGGKVQVIFDVIVTATNLLQVANHLRELLKDIEGIEISIRGNKIFIDGEILVPGDYGRLLNVIMAKNSPYEELVVNLAELSSVTLNLLSERIQKEINTFAPNVQTKVVNGQIWLTGTTDNLEQARRAMLVAELFLPEVKPAPPLEKLEDVAKRIPNRRFIQSFIVVNAPAPKKQEKLVRVTVHFVELSKDFKRVFGVKWQPGFTADPQVTIGTTTQGGTGASGAATFTATISSLFPKLQTAQDAGFARVLKSGTLIVRSGQPATLSDETQIPFPVQGPNGTVTTERAGVGLNLSVTPLILGQSEDIQMDVDMNQVNFVGTAGNAPITAQHKVKTKLYVKSKESAAIAGVSNTDVQTKFNRDDPNTGQFTGQTSPLFTLLRSKSYNKKKSEFVIFVTPQIIEDASDGTDDLKKNFRVKVQ